MIPTAQPQTGQRPNDVGDYIKEVEISAVWKNALEKFGADAENCSADEKGEVQVAPSSRIEYPVKKLS